MSANPQGQHLALISAISETAGDWIDIDYPIRKKAEEATLTALNRFTEEALVFAVNQQMSLISEAALKSWVPISNPKKRVVGVLNPGNIPFVGLQDFLAVLLCGHDYLGSVSSKSPNLLPAFAADILGRIDSEENRLQIHFVELDELIANSFAIIASGSNDTIKEIREICKEAEFNRERLLLRGHRFSVAALSGNESDEEIESLAEDSLMHEGLGCRNVSIVFAPSGTSPDPVLEAMARFRSVFPSHPDTAGALQMAKAFLKAIDQPHAFGENLEFLMSKGDPEVQTPGHVRWTEYKNESELTSWLNNHAESVQLLVRPGEPMAGVSNNITQIRPGFAQRPSLTWCPDGRDTVAFLHGIL